MTSRRVSVLGCGIGRFGAALLAKQKNFDVFVSDKNPIIKEYKKKFLELQIDFEEGQNSVEKILQCDILIKSPGIPLDHEIITLARQKSIQILDEIAFAAQYTRTKLIGITGSNGKSTVSFMVYKILKDAGKKVEICGNMGKSLALSIYEQHDVDFFVIELSSFQLEFFNKTHLDIACIVNISENHLDYHKTFENYRNAKLHILDGLTKEDLFVHNGEDENIIVDTVAKKVAVHNSEVRNFDKKFLQVEGDHNIFDALLSMKICLALGVHEEKILESLQTYQGLPHRIEFVREVRGVYFFDDSKSTTIASTEAALNFVIKKHEHGNIVWLAGGGDKGNDYSKLLRFLPFFRKIICIGKDNKKILKAFGEEVCIEEIDMKKIVTLALQVAQKNDVVLLSPACTSLDVYANFEQRGELFQKEILILN